MMLYSLILIQTLVTNINLNDDHFDDNDFETIIHVRLVAWCNKHKQLKAFTNKLSKNLIIAAWRPTRRWDWCRYHKTKRKKQKHFLLMKSDINKDRYCFNQNTPINHQLPKGDVDYWTRQENDNTWNQ